MTEPRLVHRYEWKVEDIGRDADQICVDRLTGKIVVRYDLGDPANYAASYGGWSKSEYLERKGLDPDEKVDLAQCVVPVSASEVEWLKRTEERQAQREKEEAEARDLHAVFPDLDCDVGSGYCGKNWRDWEVEVAAPAMETEGYSNVGFYMIEQDSFGPLIRGVKATSPDGKAVRFFYG